MDAKQVLDQLLNAGRGLASDGMGYARQAQDRLATATGVGTDEASQETFGKGALGGALAAGALTLLLGTRSGRKLGGVALRAGAVAGLGTLAYKAWQKATGGGDAEDGQPIDTLEGDAAETRSMAILTALIAAAKADGHIDDREREVIATRLRGLDGTTPEALDALLAQPADPEMVAGLVDDGQGAREVYAASFFIVDESKADERDYLDRLAGALRLDRDTTAAIEAEVQAA